MLLWTLGCMCLFKLLFSLKICSGEELHSHMLILFLVFFKEPPYCSPWWLFHSHQVFSSVHSLSRVRLFASPWIAARQASLSITDSQSLPKLLSVESVMPSSHCILCRPFLLLPPIPPASGSFPVSQLFTSGAKVLEFQLQHQSFQ